MESPKPPPNGGRKKKNQKQRPWLRPAGEEIPTAELEHISKAWDRATWTRYLKWYESGRREALVAPHLYKKKSESISESVFKAVLPSATPAKRNLCNRILATVPEFHRSILHLHFLDGLKISQVAEIVGGSRTNIGYHKRSALSRLKRGLAGDIWSSCRYMRDENLKTQAAEPSVWDQCSPNPVREPRFYDPNDEQVELANLTREHLRKILQELGAYSRRILYLRHWCAQPVTEVARGLRAGVNLIEQIDAAAIVKVKQKAIEFETAIPMGGASC